MSDPDRPWYGFRLAAVLELVAVSMIALALLATVVYRARLAAIPEIGRATPPEELRAAWAEADREDETPKRAPITMPQIQPHPERRP